MSGMGARLTTILLLTTLAIAVTASSGAAASTQRSAILGVVPHSARPAATVRLNRSLAAVRAALPAKLTFDANYMSLINRYLADVAHDSGGTDNVYSVATQYTDGSGPVQYQSTFGGSYVDRDPLPKSGCTDGQNKFCLTDTQL